MFIKPTHPFLSSSQDIVDIVKPLQSLGITYFTYTKTETNGNRTYLSTHPHILKKYIKEEYYLIGNSECDPKKYNSQIIFWDSLPNQHIYDDLPRSQNIDHGIYMVNRGIDYCEFYGFAAKKGNYKVLNAYINHLDGLKNFILFFKDHAQRLLKRAEANKMRLPFNNAPVNFMDDSEDIIFESLTKDTTNTTSSLRLSPRQMDCAVLLLKGMPYKEIALALNISPRTVETHLNYLKEKLGCSNKTQLVLYLLNSTLVNT